MKKDVIFVIFLVIFIMTEGFSSVGNGWKYKGEYSNNDILISIESNSTRAPQGGKAERVPIKHEFNIEIKAKGKYFVTENSYLIFQGKKYFFNKKPGVVDKKWEEKEDNLISWVYRRDLNISNLDEVFVNGEITVYYEFKDQYNKNVKKQKNIKLSIKKGKLIKSKLYSTIYMESYNLIVNKIN